MVVVSPCEPTSSPCGLRSAKGSSVVVESTSKIGEPESIGGSVEREKGKMSEYPTEKITLDLFDLPRECTLQSDPSISHAPLASGNPIYHEPYVLC